MKKIDLKDKAIVVTGGAGFIGSHLVDKLLTLDPAKITIIDNLVTTKNLRNINHLINHPKINFVRDDISSLGFVESMIQDSDVVFNLAASKLVVSLNDPYIDVKTNIIGTLNVLEAVRKASKEIKLVHASTGSVFGSATSIPMKETYKKSPTTIYGINKLAGEQYCKYYHDNYGLDATVIRYFHVFGPRQDYSGEAGVVNIFLSNVLNGKPPVIFSGGEQIRCFTYVSDDVDATILLAIKEGTAGKEYNIASEIRMSINSLARMIIKKYAKEKMKPIYGKNRQGENFNPIPDTKRIERLGWTAKVSFVDGLEKTKQWIEQDLKK